MLHIDITKRLDRFSLEIVLDIDVPGITAVFGPSGAGKSTFAKILAGLCTPDGGRISFNEKVFFDGDAGVDLPPERRGVGFLFQEHRLFPHMNVFKNLSFGCFAGGRPLCGDVAEIAKVFGIDTYSGEAPPLSPAGRASARSSPARYSPRRILSSWTSLSPRLTTRSGRISWGISNGYRRCSAFR
nr:ATP-binding cassette domain-containing protein [Cloacibacillus porcorum]